MLPSLLSYLPHISLLALSVLAVPTLLSLVRQAATPLWDAWADLFRPAPIVVQSLADVVARWARLFARLTLVAAALLMLVGPQAALAEARHDAVEQETYWRCVPNGVTAYLCEVRGSPSQMIRETMVFANKAEMEAAIASAHVPASILYQAEPGRQMVYQPALAESSARARSSGWRRVETDEVRADGPAFIEGHGPVRQHRDIADQFSDIRRPSPAAPGLLELSLVLAGLALLLTATRKVTGWKGMGIALASLLVSSVALAQVVDGGAGSVVLPQVDPNGDPLAQAQVLLNILANWHSVGMVGSLIAAVNMVVNLTKLPIFESLTAGRPWLKPSLALVTGSLLAGLGAAASGAALPGALLAGLVAGLGSAGLHELVTVFINAPKVAARQAGDAIAAQVAKGDAAAKATWEVQKAHVDAAFNIPDERARLEHLADLGNAQAKAG